jgi:putative flippase GtrA
VKHYLRTFLTKETGSQFVKVGVIGVVNTVVDFGLFNIMRSVGVGRYVAITGAFAAATLLSYLLNRRWSFELTDGKVSLRETTHFYWINAAAWAVTVAIVWIADQWFGPLNQAGENAAKLAAVVVILLPKFAGYRDIVFRSALDQRAAADRAEEHTTADGGL